MFIGGLGSRISMSCLYGCIWFMAYNDTYHRGIYVVKSVTCYKVWISRGTLERGMGMILLQVDANKGACV